MTWHARETKIDINQLKTKLTFSHQSTSISHTQQKPTQTTESTLPTKDRNQEEGGIRPQNLRKGDLKHNTLKKEKKKGGEVWCK